MVMATTTLIRPIVLALSTLALLALAGCASRGFEAEVTRFHQMAVPSGQKVAVEPAEEMQQRQIGFGAFAGLIAERLEREGYRRARGGEPDIVATVAYGSEPAPGYRAGSGPRLGIGFGGFGSRVGGGVSTSVPLDNPDLYYRHWLSLVLADARTGRRLFEGTSSGFAKGPDMLSVMPLLADALFQAFPGQSGETITVKFDE